MLKFRLNSADAVIGTVAVSALVTAFCGIVIATNAYDALHGAPARSQTATQSAEVGRAVSPAAEAIAVRTYPMAEGAPGLARPLSFPDEALAILRNPPGLGEQTVQLARLPQVARPPNRSAPDSGAEGALIRVARNLTPAQAALLRAPLARPAAPNAEVPIVTASAPNEPVAAPPLPEVAATLVSLSPRPPARPGGAATFAARQLAPSAPGTPSLENIVVARAVAPETGVAPARLTETPDAPRLEPPRAGGNPCSDRLARAIPRRPGGAPTGSALMAALGNGSGGGRDDAIVSQALAGNVPDHLRNLQPVRFTGTAGGRQTEIILCVTPDYLAVGSDGDHVRVPLGLPAALRVAEGFDMMLPTTRMVDAIYAQASLRLRPRPMTPGPQMSSTDYFLRHDATLDAQFAEAGGRPGLLVAGHKKDLVLANRLSANRGRVAIYGWHRGNGDPIQPLSTVHGAYYADYSHGIRLVSRTAYVDGRAVDLRALLTSGTHAGILNSDGPLNAATVQLASL